MGPKVDRRKYYLCKTYISIIWTEGVFESNKASREQTCQGVSKHEHNSKWITSLELLYPVW